MESLPAALRPTTVSSLSRPPLLVPPINFALVATGVYRSGHPNRKNFGFLSRLGLKTVIYVEGEEEYRKDGADFVEQEGLTLHTFALRDEEALFTRSGRARLDAALAVILDTRNHPLLIHDDTGKATATLVCALIRTFQCWALTAIFAEGTMFARAGGSEGGGVGNAGSEFIAMFDPRSVLLEREHVPPWAQL